MLKSIPKYVPLIMILQKQMDWKTKISVDFQAFKILHSHWRFHSQAENKIIFVVLKFFHNDNKRYWKIQANLLYGIKSAFLYIEMKFPDPSQIHANSYEKSQWNK